APAWSPARNSPIIFWTAGAAGSFPRLRPANPAPAMPTWAAPTSAPMIPGQAGMTAVLAAVIGAATAVGAATGASRDGMTCARHDLCGLASARHGVRHRIVQRLHAERNILHHAVHEEGRGRANVAAAAALDV